MALELDLPAQTINRINKDHDCIEDKCYDMFDTWLQRSPDACWCHIVKALKMRNMLQLANDIEKSFLSEEWINSVQNNKAMYISIVQLLATQLTRVAILVHSGACLANH